MTDTESRERASSRCVVGQCWTPPTTGDRCDEHRLLPSQLQAREDAALLVCLALGYSHADGSFQEPDESFCEVIYGAVDGDQDCVGEVAVIGRHQRAADSELPEAVSRNLYWLKRLADSLELRRAHGYPGRAADLATSIWRELDTAHRDYREMKGMPDV